MCREKFVAWVTVLSLLRLTVFLTVFFDVTGYAIGAFLPMKGQAYLLLMSAVSKEY